MLKLYLSKSPNINSALCLLCKNVHALYKCESFLNLTPEKRYAFVRNNNLCLDCFSLHKVAYYRYKLTCIICKSKHHLLLHRNELPFRGQRSQDSSPEGEKQPESSGTPSVKDFFHNVQNPRKKRSGSLAQQELTQGKRIIIHAVQVIEFREDLNNLRKGNPVV
ncbi:hypothetical protein NPIL_307931, partial [Nephila pilipes]